MAGFYSDVPAHRFALDVDGTVFKHLDVNKTTLSDASTTKASVLDTDSDYHQFYSVDDWEGGGVKGYYVLVFPELRNIDAYFIALSGTGAMGYNLEYSSNTTDGLDGTWTVATANWSFSTTLSPNYRTAIVPQVLTNVKSLRFGWGVTGGSYSEQFRIQTMHLYGSIVGGQNPDRLRFWHPTLDQEASGAHFDFGDVPVGTFTTKQFRIKNNSATLTANSITLSKSSASFADVDTGLTFSSDNSSYTTTLGIGNLAPGAISPILYVRRTVAAGETASIPKDGRLSAAATTWS